MAKRLRAEEGKYLREILLDSKALNRGLYKKESIVKFVNDFIYDKGYYYYPGPNGMAAMLIL